MTCHIQYLGIENEHFKSNHIMEIFLRDCVHYTLTTLKMRKNRSRSIFCQEGVQNNECHNTDSIHNFFVLVETSIVKMCVCACQLHRHVTKILSKMHVDKNKSGDCTRCICWRGGAALLDVKNMVPVEIAIFGHITTRGHIQRCKLWLSLFRANEGLRGGK